MCGCRLLVVGLVGFLADFTVCRIRFYSMVRVCLT